MLKGCLCIRTHLKRENKQLFRGKIFMCIKTINYILSSLTYEPPPGMCYIHSLAFFFSFFPFYFVGIQTPKFSIALNVLIHAAPCCNTKGFFSIKREKNTEFQLLLNFRNAATGMMHICTSQNRIFISSIVVLFCKCTYMYSFAL